MYYFMVICLSIILDPDLTKSKTKSGNMFSVNDMLFLHQKLILGGNVQKKKKKTPGNLAFRTLCILWGQSLCYGKGKWHDVIYVFTKKK